MNVISRDGTSHNIPLEEPELLKVLISKIDESLKKKKI